MHGEVCSGESRDRKRICGRDREDVFARQIPPPDLLYATSAPSKGDVRSPTPPSRCPVASAVQPLSPPFAEACDPRASPREPPATVPPGVCPPLPSRKPAPEKIVPLLNLEFTLGFLQQTPRRHERLSRNHDELALRIHGMKSMRAAALPSPRPRPRGQLARGPTDGPLDRTFRDEVCFGACAPSCRVSTAHSGY